MDVHVQDNKEENNTHFKSVAIIFYKYPKLPAIPSGKLFYIKISFLQYFIISVFKVIEIQHRNYYLNRKIEFYNN
jgi:hypothetical protein